MPTEQPTHQHQPTPGGHCRVDRAPLPRRGTGAATQLDLFGDVLAAEQRDQRILHEAAAWRARFDRVEWSSPLPNITPRLGYRCPDPDCRQVEPAAFVLAINHGFDPDTPGRQPHHGRCHRVTRRGGDHQ
ncbi:hypothetical protein CLV30_101123 [Haloactinopolyspora alba]|uniref:Uncharacterized protein n=1 Tax=Haloactinopolyspora alba TaxID=648780 RepID=A0A2P8EFB4_9ACTN|nr:hypothetical protein [Haloactinopolyspora alba]PSL08156.1 hypothetical protein CLV30_101123 [Haloactinopolyspora alba]